MPPSSKVYWFQKYKDQVWEMIGSAASGMSFHTQNYEGFSKFIKKKYICMSFQFLCLEMIAKAKSASETVFLKANTIL